MQTIRFGKGRGQEVPDTSRLLMGAQLKYAAKVNLPASEKKGVLFYTTDTEEFYYGQGLGLPLGSMSDTAMINDESELPQAHERPDSKLFIIKSTGIIYYWDDVSNQYKSAGSTELTQEVETINNRIIELESISEASDRIILLEDNIHEFILSKNPINEISMFVNGIKYYYERSFNYNTVENKAIWIFDDNNNGFNLEKDFEIEFKYKYKEEE